MEKDKIIKEINKMGINQRSNNQQDLHEQETNRKAIEGIRESFMEKEQTNKERLEAAYRTQIHNLNQEVAKQKQANVNNYETSLARLNFQENTIYTLEQEKEHYKHELDKMTKVNRNQVIELKHKSKEISHYINNAEQYNEKIRELNNKIRVMTEIEMEYKKDQTEDRMQIEDLEAAINSQYHTTEILYNDLQEARREIAKLTTEANHTSLESQQEESAVSEESNTLDNNEDEKNRRYITSMGSQCRKFSAWPTRRRVPFYTKT